jgi:hypothetical protein
MIVVQEDMWQLPVRSSGAFIDFGNQTLQCCGTGMYNGKPVRILTSRLAEGIFLLLPYSYGVLTQHSAGGHLLGLIDFYTHRPIAFRPLLKWLSGRIEIGSVEQFVELSRSFIYIIACGNPDNSI